MLRRGSAPVLKNAGAEAWDLGDGVLGLTFKTKANSIDADVIKMIHDAVARAERDFRAMVIWNQGEFFCVGANLFAVVVAAGQKQWDQLREMINGYQYATQRMKYSTRAGRRRAVQHDARRWSRAVHRRDGGASGGRDLLRPRRGRRRPDPRRRRHDEHAVALDGEHPRGHRHRHLRVRHPDVQEHRAREGRDVGRGRQGVRLLPQHRRRVVRSRAPAVGSEAARDRARERRPSSAGAARVQAAGRERHRDAADARQHARTPASTRASTTRRSR